MTQGTRLKELIDRLARLAAAEERSDRLNPAQRQALAYLARANRFSRAPSHVAAYLNTTRGTASQTLKALERKGFIARAPGGEDKRSVAYEVMQAGHAELAQPGDLEAVLDGLPEAQADALAEGLAALLQQGLARRGQRSFGMCRTCRHHRVAVGDQPAWCDLLEVGLAPEETGALCHEHEAA